MIVSFYLEPLGHETFFYRDAVYGSSICRRLKNIFEDAIIDIKLEDKEYVYHGKCKCTIIFNEKYNRTTLVKIRDNIKHILERVACSSKISDDHALHKHIIKINGYTLYEFNNSNIEKNADKEYSVIENFKTCNGDAVSIVSYYY